MEKNNTLNIFGCVINALDYNSLTEVVDYTITNGEKLLVTYANFNTLNILYRKKELTEVFPQFNIVHPDGIGVLIASKILFGKSGLKKRFSGSDFYPILIEQAIKNNWNIFFFGDKLSTLENISKNHCELKIAGVQKGYNFDNEVLVAQINKSKPDILIVGLGCPKQEQWILKNKDKITPCVIMAVGDGIKVFAGTKTRGPLFLQNIGMEWLVRLIFNPGLYWKRYLLGIPLFIARILKYKLILIRHIGCVTL